MAVFVQRERKKGRGVDREKGADCRAKDYAASNRIDPARTCVPKELIFGCLVAVVRSGAKNTEREISSEHPICLSSTSIFLRYLGHGRLLHRLDVP